MKRADLIAALVLAIISFYMMLKSMELPIGWEAGKGPGGGAFPFWLSAGMLICSVLIFIRNLAGLSLESKDTQPFMETETLKLFLTVSIALIAMIGAIHIVGVYVSVPLFVAFYMRHLGKHSWTKTLVISLTIPVVTFLFFEKLLLLLLPKGVTEEWFYIFF
ncbi:MAG: tripartite tricarboxylate transporter TctB family protein [SAR324 cluster bacterium]|nr:tripartite tricarboxylate transporter TctB family protein [SAR324 cluster bacterium]